MHLRSIGAFALLKASLSSALGLNIATRSWDTLYRLIVDVQAVALEPVSIDVSLPDHPADSARCRLSMALLSATSAKDRLVQTSAVISQAIERLVAAASDPSVQFQARRSRNFHYSCRLEGIDMAKVKHADSLQSILDQRRRR
ncbi:MULTISPECIES: YhfG family protein [Stenotrophomonas]|uniref:YhfG family protein n=1 Tax=Stenotrophomonas TaxID=40323 RepID=UPI001559FB3D|nr:MULTISPECIES: YhfG family protein [Stenotrophomonas]